MEIQNKPPTGYPLILDAERLGAHDRWASVLRLDISGAEVKEYGYDEDFPRVFAASPFPTLEDAIEFGVETAHRLGYKATIWNKRTTP